MSDPANQPKAIFLEAVEKHTPDQWPAFLDQACAGDAALRAEVEKLLQARAELGSFHEPARANPVATVDEPVTERPGTVIGPYKLLEQIGEGGFGVVFMAEQSQPVRRKVALKVLKPGMDTRQVVARFEAERQALAIMDHPNIAKVHDGGATPSGRPYFVMELVKGVPITEFCDQNHLTPRQRLELFIPVCQAVQHAHQKGIIHRDLKPSNVLVSRHDTAPVVKVIDFGVAKAMGQELTDKTLFTGIAQMVGTPLYMSPEQAGMSDLDVDTRSDIYSLGVLLYELLTGTTPFTKERFNQAAYDEIRRIIREEEPPRPSTRLSESKDSLPSISAQRQTEPAKLTRLVRGELDWIVMKALEKDRNRRYETANGLARDIERYLHDEPVQAGPPSAWYRFRKFGRRHKGSLIAAALVLFALIAGILGTTGGLIWAEMARRDALKAADAEKTAKDEALDHEAETTAVLDFVENKVIAAARPKDQEGGQGYDVKLADAVKAALPFVDKSFTDRPLIEARLRKTMGTSFWYLGDARTAIEQHEKALALYTKHRGPDHPDTLRSMSSVASCYQIAGRTQEALKLREETLRLMEAKLGPDHPDTLKSRTGLAYSYLAAGRSQEALKLGEETLPLVKAKLGPDHTYTLDTMNILANSYAAAGRWQEALKLNEEALRLKKAKLGPDHPDTLGTAINLANSYAEAGRTQEALKLREETLPLLKAKHGPDHRWTLMSMMNLANSYAAVGRAQEAVKLGEETLQLQKAKLGPVHPDTLNSMNNLASSYADVGRAQDALKLREETLQLRKAKLGPDHPHTLLSMNNLAKSYIAVRQAAKAVAILQDTLTLRERRVKAEPGNSSQQSSLAFTHGQMGQAEQLRADYAAAAQAYARSVEMFEKLDQAGALKDPLFRARLSYDRHRLALCRTMSMMVLANSYDAAGRTDEALKLREETLRLQKAAVESAAKMKDLAGPDAPGPQLYDAACAYALCAGAAKQAKGPVAGAPGPEKLAEEALALLKQAVAKGYKDAARMKQDRDLDALRDRPDFQNLLAGLEAGKKK